jgi:lysozyme
MTATYPKNQAVIDLSHWNTVNSWKAIVDDGVVGVVHKFSQGVSYRDPDYNQRMSAAIDVGLLFGRYHFGDGSNVQDQVSNFLIGWIDHELLALDWETNTTGPTMSTSQAVEFVQEVERRTGVIPVLYSGNVLKESEPREELMNCRLWLAHYANQPVCPLGWEEPWLWQWTEAGVISGVVGPVDLDSFAGRVDMLVDTWAPEFIS